MENNYFSGLSDEELFVAYGEFVTLESTGTISKEDGHGHMRKAIDMLGEHGSGILLASAALQQEISKRWYQERAAVNEMLREGDNL